MAGLARYLTAAVLVRGADSGATVGLLLLAADRHQQAAVGGLLVAALNAPHLAGPWLAARLDRAADRRRLLAAAYVVYGVALSAGALALGRLPTVAAIAAVALAGACGPLLTGGLSSVLGDLGSSRTTPGGSFSGAANAPALGRAGGTGTGATNAAHGLGWDKPGDLGPGCAGRGTCATNAADPAPSRRRGRAAPRDADPSRRRRGWDALTYGVGNTAGPAAAAGLTAFSGSLAAVLVLAVSALAGGALTLALPLTGRTEAAETVSLRAGLAVLVRRPPLRRVTVLTLLGAVELGALPVIAVRFGAELHGSAAAGATLTVAYGAGSLLGSALVTARPLQGEPEVLAVRLFAAMAVATAACALAPGYAIAGFGVLGLLNATSFTATLAARGAYAPAGAQAQVFVTSAGLKVAMAAAGAALAGAVGQSGPVLLLGAAATTGLGVVAARLDARCQAGRTSSGR
ncbi:MFS transporter [Amycolatopsis sp. NPDC051102]|uniref:MFS transporter n=1 Tax=Amycolatopsis sp. NPDC051102 TaxID=3155163 RepID=UPI00341D7604